MSDQDRGAYTPPTDAPLSFDARQPVRGSRPAPMMLVVSAIILLVLVGAVVLIYRSGAREAGEAPPVVGAPVGEIKAEALPDDQPIDPATGLQIYQSEPDESAAPNFVPPPEEPQPRPATPVETRAVPPAVPPAPKPAAQPAPSQPAPKPAAAQPAPAQPAPKPAAAASSGAAVVQVGAFSSQALAEAGWADAMRAVPDAGARGRRVEPVESNGKTLYRGYVTGFETRAEATAFCDRLKAAGRSCFVR